MLMRELLANELNKAIGKRNVLQTFEKIGGQLRPQLHNSMDYNYTITILFMTWSSQGFVNPNTY